MVTRSALSPLHRWTIAHPVAILIGVAALTGVALLRLFDLPGGELRLRLDPSTEPLIARSAAQQDATDEVLQRFGGEDTVLVMLDVGDAFAPAALQQIDRVSRALYALPMIDAVRSLTTVPLPRNTGEAILLHRLRRDEYDDRDVTARLRTIVQEDSLLRGTLVSEDGRRAAVILTLAAGSEELGDVGVTIRTAAERAAEGVRVAVAGGLLIREETSRAALEQLRWLLPVLAITLTAVLVFAFRSWASVLLPLATIFLTLIWTLGALSALGRPLNLITCLVPPLLVTIALAYCAHILSEFEALREDGGGDSRARVMHLLDEVGGPVVLTGATTAIGLLALLLTQLPAIREFALLGAFGVACTVLLVLTFVPAALLLIGSANRSRPLPGRSWLDAHGRRLGEFDTRHRRRILAVAALVGIVALGAASELRFGDALIGAFREDARVRQDAEAINAAFGGVHPVSISIDATQAEAFSSPVALQRLQELQDWLRAQPEVGAVTGLVDHVVGLHRLFVGGEGLPDRQSVVRQLLFFGDSEAARSLVNGDLSATRVQLRLNVDDTAAVDAWLLRLEQRLQELPEHWRVAVTGESVALARSVRTVTREQLGSIALALTLVYLCLAVQFASPWVGFLAALPTFLQTAIYFGMLGLGGLQLNATTCLVECLVLGLAVDDTIHYLARFNRASKQTGSETEGAVRALSAVLRPVTLTKGVLALGLLLLVTGELRNQALFGWLAASTLFAAWLVDLLITPALMSGVRIVTLWDTLRLNLGRDPHTTIPLFAGLTPRQARIFALMARLETFAPGTCIIREADPAGDIFVAIDGELQVYTERHGGRKKLGTVGRGAIFGETGYFGQRRTATVEAVSMVRVLRFDDADQERICKRYPEIASRIFLNLNRLQASRHPHPAEHVAQDAALRHRPLPMAP